MCACVCFQNIQNNLPLAALVAEFVLLQHFFQLTKQAEEALRERESESDAAERGFFGLKITTISL